MDKELGTIVWKSGFKNGLGFGIILLIATVALVIYFTPHELCS